jgi:uncharacterized protein YdeI (YjbR/CyaY-like superfamily)
MRVKTSRSVKQPAAKTAAKHPVAAKPAAPRAAATKSGRSGTAAKTPGPKALAAKSPAADKATAKDALPVLAFAQPRDWAAWLAKHHAQAPGVWLKLAKKDSGIASVTYAQALEVALAWGWIDGQKQAHDATAWLQRFTPRGPRSIWSKINRDKALALIAAGEMKPAGLAEVERAKADGRWAAAYDSQSRSAVPEDLAAALKASPRAAAFFATLDSANRYAILFRLHTAKKPETRARRLEQFVGMLERGEKIHG